MMKNILYALCLVVLMIGCRPLKKEEVTPESKTMEITSIAQTDDNKNLNDALDNALTGLKDGFSGAARMDAVEKSGVVVDYSKFKTEKTITYTYDGITNENGAIKSGKIVVKLESGAKFEDKGSIYSATFQAFSTKISGTTIKLEGSLKATNVSGGNAWLTIFGWPGYTNPVIEKIRGSATATIDTSKAATWQFARTTTVARKDTLWTISIDGDTSINGFTKVIDWGTNRYGEIYYKEMTEPFLISSNCGGLFAFLRPSGGKCKITVEKKDKSKYFINWSWLIDTVGCGNGFSLSVSDDKKNEWNFSAKY